MAKRIAAAVLFALVAIAAVAPIRSYDYFWHLAAGRWIVDHHAIPAGDPLAVASAKIPWINGEWLFEVVLKLVHNAGGDGWMSIWNALLIAAIFTLGFWYAAREQQVGTALLIAAIAFAGAWDRLGVRPSTAAALLVVAALALLASQMRVSWLAIGYALLTVVWINVHPSALLAPLFAVLSLTIGIRRWPVAVASAAALLINPFGWRAVAAPLQLTSLIGSGEFVNAEWLPSDMSLFPLLYTTFALVILAFVVTPAKRANAWRAAVFVVLAVLAVQHVRNQGLYFAALPLLLPPLMRRSLQPILAALAVVPIAWSFGQTSHERGIDAERFPVRAVALLRASQLPGNIYNVDQFGGLLEWTFYPQRRVLTDGRNELFRDFIEQDATARRDSRAWRALLDQYNVALAVDEYQRERIEVVDVASGERRSLPASLVRYRRRDWALIAFDDAAMVFARRAAFPPERLASLEYNFLVPDDPEIRYLPQYRDAARAEIARARREIGDVNVVRALERGAE